jgi:hypothetical protein
MWEHCEERRGQPQSMGFVSAQPRLTWIDDVHSEHRKLLEDKFAAYLDVVEKTDLSPPEPYLSFDFSFLFNRIWRISLAEWLVEADLRELTNNLNDWQSLLISWEAWNRVIGQQNDETSLWLRREFCVSLAHDCLLRPSAVKDTFITVATQSLHQIRMAEDHAIPDKLDTDPKEYKEKFITRSEKERQLTEICQRWANAKTFRNALEELNTNDYQIKTFRYRNLHSHTVGPRLGFGDVRPVARLVQKAQTLTHIGNGQYELKEIDGQTQVVYSFGGIGALEFEFARKLNLEQYYVARRCYDAYVSLLKDIVCKLPTTPHAAK